MSKSHESLHKIGEEPQVDTVAISDSLAALVDLRRKENQLIQQMLEKTHEIVREAFEWQKEQGLKWKKWWKPEVGLQQTRHISYYYMAEEENNQVLLEVFMPVIIDRLSRAPIDPETICIVEYPLDSQDNPLTFDPKTLVGASAFGKHTSNIDMKLEVSLKEDAVGVASYTMYPIFKDERSGEDRISGDCNSFGWSSSSYGSSYSTHIPLSYALPEFRGANVKIGVSYSKDPDPLFEGQRRLGLLKNAQLIGISVPPERVIAPYSK